jgi:hypothetical protein
MNLKRHHRRYLRHLRLLFLLALIPGAAAQSLYFSAGRMRFTFSPNHTVRLTADGVPIIRESHLYMVNQAWTAAYLNADNVTPTVTSTTINGVRTGYVTYETADAVAKYKYELGPDETYRVTVNYATKGKTTQVEWDAAYLNANLIAGMPWSASTVSGARSGTTPLFATSEDQTASQLCPYLYSIHFDTNLGPLDISVQGSDSSCNSLRLFDARGGKQDWAMRNPIFWLGLGVWQIPGTAEGQTVTMTVRLGAAPARTIVPKLDAAPVVRDVSPAKVPYVPDLPVIPHPKSEAATPLPCRIAKRADIVVPASPSAEEQQAAAELKTELASFWGVTASVVSSVTPGVPAIILSTAQGGNVPPYAEGYCLYVNGEGVTITGHDGRGVYNGAQTLKQLLRADADGVYVKAASIRDWPTLAMRGVHWFGGPGGWLFHKAMFDRIVGPYKLNTMLYECEFGKWASHPEIWSSERGMSKDEMKRTVDYARAHFVEPIPLINSLGHADWMLWNGQHLDLATNPQDPYQYDPENPAVYDILFDVMQEAADLFQPKYFHIGHDEVTTGGTFPKPGSTKTATQLILADVAKINDWVKARGMRTMMWGDEFLYYPTEASDAGNATSLTQARTRRNGLAKDIIITDWHYAATTSYPSVPIWKNGGWDVVGVPWYNWTNIQNLAKSITQYAGMGLIQSTWAGWSMYPDIVNTSAYPQFVAYLVAAEMAWSGANPLVDNLGYSPDEAFQRAWNRSAVDLKTYTGFAARIGTGNAPMWSWLPGSWPAAPFPEGTQVWSGVTFDLGGPVWLAGGLNPPGTWPLSVEIPLEGRTAQEVQFLWGTTWRGEMDGPVATLRATYTDGYVSDTPILYGTHILGFTDTRGSLQTSPAGTGIDPAGQKVAVRRWAWSNPRRDMPMRSLTITSSLGEAAPVILAVTGVRPWQPPFTTQDALRALGILAGATTGTGSDIMRYKAVPGSGPIEMADAVRAARKAAGLD